MRKDTINKQKPSNNYAFIDSQNLNLGTQKMGWKMDWRKFRKLLADQYGVTKAYMFIGHMPEHEDLYEQMHNAGFLVVLKPTLETLEMLSPQITQQINADDAKNVNEKSPDSPPRMTKGNIDADLVLWAVKEAPHYGKAIVVSGDGDFYSLYEYLVEKKKLLHIMTPNWQYSSLLKPYEKYIIRIDQMRRQLEYRSFKKPKV